MLHRLSRTVFPGYARGLSLRELGHRSTHHCISRIDVVVMKLARHTGEESGAGRGREDDPRGTIAFRKFDWTGDVNDE